MTLTAMKWTIDEHGNWVRRCFDLTITPSGKSDTQAVLRSTQITKETERNDRTSTR